MTQTKDELELFYSDRDPWSYQRTPDDIKRRVLVTKIINLFGNHFERFLDVGSGEGFMTIFVKAREKHGIELSDAAAQRFPSDLERVHEPVGKYDLVTALGVLYEQYDYQQMREWIEGHASGLVVTSHYNEAGIAHDKFDKQQLFYATFPYRNGKQVLRVYDFE